MKRDPLIRKVVLSSLFIAGIPTILFLFFLPPLGSKYNLLIEPAGKNAIQPFYSDLNSDSISETIHSSKGLPYFFIAVRDHDLRFFDQWNLTDSLNPNISEIFSGNYDHDRFSELYVFTHRQDSLFLNVNEILEPGGTKLERYFISKIGYKKDEVVSILYPIGFYDEDRDGMDEYYFGITSAFNLGPRHIYAFDIVHRRLINSQFTGIIALYPQMIDVDGDLKPEIFGTMSASGNYRANVPFSDSSTWFMVFNDTLGFEFHPVEFPGFANGLEINSFKNDLFRGYLLSHHVGNTDTTGLASGILTYSPLGELLRYRPYTDFGSSLSLKLFVIRNNKSDRIYLIGDKFLELNEKLEVIRSIDLPFPLPVFQYQVDLNADGQNEILLYSEDEGKVVAYSAGLQKLAEQKFRTPDTNWKFYNYLTKDHEQKVFLSSGNSGSFVKLKSNNLYYLGYLAYPGIYLMFFLFITFVKRINTWQVVQKESLNRRLLTLQLQGIKSQLDPHFTFNTLNSVASLIYLEDRETAYDYLNKFTQLFRGMINDAERIYRSLAEELAFVTTYLDLEKLRFGEKFDYNVEIGSNITQSEQVPKLVLQTFTENAIKHGILPGTNKGFIKISISREDDYLKLTIEDNGIGRVKSAGQSNSTGRGLKITGEFYDILNQINKKPIKHYITDLYDDFGHASGTRVDVWVPVEEGVEAVGSKQ
jgi:two-component sensor histidine kinase